MRCPRKEIRGNVDFKAKLMAVDFSMEVDFFDGGGLLRWRWTSSMEVDFSPPKRSVEMELDFSPPKRLIQK